MPDAKSWTLPAPADHQSFERLCLDILAARKRPIADPSLFGRNGQAQHGVDFTLELQDALEGYQSKLVEEFSLAELEAEVNKTVGFPADLDAFTVLTTAKRDASVQGAVLALSQRRRRAGQFPVSIVYWTTIQGWLAEHLDILKAHYPQITPDLVELLVAQARRLDSEFPGAHLTVDTKPGETNYTVHPGPDGIPFRSTLIGAEVAKRFEDALRLGTPVTFEDDEFELELPPALSFLTHREGGGKRSLTMTPTLNGHQARVLVEVEPSSSHRTMEMFARRARRRAQGIPAVLRFLQAGSELQTVEVAPEQLPLRFVVEHQLADGALQGQARCERVYHGATVEAALAAEEVLQVLDEGAYVGIFGDGLTITWENEARDRSGEQLLEVLQLLADLAAAADWEIDIPEAITPDDVHEVASLLELFTTGRRVVGRGGAGNIDVRDDEQLGAFKSFIESGQLPFNARVVADGHGGVELLGQTHPMPRTALVYSQIILPEETREGILSAAAPPVTVRFVVPDDVEVIEELVD